MKIVGCTAARVARDAINLINVNRSHAVPLIRAEIPLREAPHPQNGAPPLPGAFAAVWPQEWAFLRSPAADGATNMAVDSVLLALAGEGHRAVWRCYAWDEPTLSFGRNETTRDRFSAAGLMHAGLRAVRRPTGGRALLHAREVTYSVTMPLPQQHAWRTAYAAVNSVLLQALQSLGVPAELVAAPDAPPIAPDGPLCFDQPAAGEITVHGRKLVGSAVWRHGGAYLQHGSILLSDDQSRLTQAADRALPPSPPAATLEACAPAHASWSSVVDALERALTRSVATASPRPTSNHPIVPFAPPADFAARVAEQRDHFADAKWLWRR